MGKAVPKGGNRELSCFGWSKLLGVWQSRRSPPALRGCCWFSSELAVSHAKLLSRGRWASGGILMSKRGLFREPELV